MGLSYMRGRWYDPAAGRFVQEDPLGVDGGINVYAFSGDDPVNGSDPAGTCPVDQLRYQTNADSWSLVCGTHGGILATGPLGSGWLTPVVVSADPKTGPIGGGLPPLPPLPPSPAAPGGTNATSDVSRGTDYGSLTGPTALDYEIDRWARCTGSALLENLPGLALDGAGIAVTVLLPEAQVGATVAGSLLGVAGIGLAVADHAGIADGVTSGGFAVAGKVATLGAVVSAKGSYARFVWGRLGIAALAGSITVDAGKTVLSAAECINRQ